MFRGSIRKDMENPLLASVSATYLMTIMQLATYLAPYAWTAALVFWGAAVVMHAVLIVWFTMRILPEHRLKDVYPTFFIAYVGIVVASVTSPMFGLARLGLAIFWFGFVAYMAMLVLVTVRCLREPLAQGARPTLCIYAAPMSLSLTGYLAACPQPDVVFACVLGVLAQGLLLFVLVKLPGLLRLPFFPSYAAMTFPLVISSTALGKLLVLLNVNGIVYPAFLGVLVVAETVLAACMVGYVLVRYSVYLVSEVRSKAEAREEARVLEAVQEVA